MDDLWPPTPKAWARVVEHGCEFLHGGRVTRTWDRWSDGRETYADYAESTLTTRVGGITMSVGTACCGSGDAPIPAHVAMTPVRHREA